MWQRITPSIACYRGANERWPWPALRIARHPVTVAQYRAFRQAGDGYKNDAWWEGLERPGYQLEPAAEGDAWPVTLVDWREAVAFTRWLDHRLRRRGDLGPDEQLRLPTEWEWQQAASGGEPANTQESGIMRTLAVGLYPGGASPVGALDMAGNVWEWCLNAYEEPADTTVGGEVSRAVRGGFWLLNRDGARAAFRYWGGPDARNGGLGLFRPPSFRTADHWSTGR